MFYKKILPVIDPVIMIELNPNCRLRVVSLDYQKTVKTTVKKQPYNREDFSTQYAVLIKCGGVLSVDIGGSCVTVVARRRKMVGITKVTRPLTRNYSC